MRTALLSVLLVLLCASPASATLYQYGLPQDASPRVRYGLERLKREIERKSGPLGESVWLVRSTDAGLAELRSTGKLPPADPVAEKPEGFQLVLTKDRGFYVIAADDSGLLYGCLELARWLRELRGTPRRDLSFADAPVMVLRGPCIGMQKTYYLPGRRVYEYPYTPEEFPFFYDKAQWTEYLDLLVDLRMNTLYLWNGHPFASLVRLPDYPEAVEVSDEVFAKNGGIL